MDDGYTIYVKNIPSSSVDEEAPTTLQQERIKAGGPHTASRSIEEHKARCTIFFLPYHPPVCRYHLTHMYHTTKKNESRQGKARPDGDRRRDRAASPCDAAFRFIGDQMSPFRVAIISLLFTWNVT